MSRREYISAISKARNVASFPISTIEYWDFSVAIFVSRDKDEEVQRAIKAIVAAYIAPVVVDVVINGNAELAERIARWVSKEALNRTQIVCIRIWTVDLANKAHAWNTFIYGIAPVAKMYVFLDGYVEVNRETFQVILEAQSKNKKALAFSGSPLTGRTSQVMKKVYEEEGGLHGNCFALTHLCVMQIRAEVIVLPIGLYGFDTVLGGMLGFGLDPRNQEWRVKDHIINIPTLHWTVPEKSVLSVRDVQTQFKRVRNNALRRIVRRATVFHLESNRRSLGELGITIDQYIRPWLEHCKRDYLSEIVRMPLVLYEIRRMHKRYSWNAALVPANCLTIKCSEN
ncbi:MAG: hypothetical protein Q8S92_16320 [Hydrogenophaga sp.]|uniref:hypothetical protein n=1 Tax=Hydrogenophaga sp. TaxID=1904254 RepID=UPI002734184A|nr:hypothetical protein [Hydrogenophaga sp.]MDP3350558.1 hypothetical protein [Hydrogenophaga sp.]